MSEYTMISVITLSNHDKNTLYLHTRDITKKDQEQSKSSFVIRFYVIEPTNYMKLSKKITRLSR
jgi:hypothetical protein